MKKSIPIELQTVNASPATSPQIAVGQRKSNRSQIIIIKIRSRTKGVVKSIAGHQSQRYNILEPFRHSAFFRETGQIYFDLRWQL